MTTTFPDRTTLRHSLSTQINVCMFLLCVCFIVVLFDLVWGILFLRKRRSMNLDGWGRGIWVKLGMRSKYNQSNSQRVNKKDTEAVVKSDFSVYSDFLALWKQRLWFQKLVLLMTSLVSLWSCILSSYLSLRPVTQGWQNSVGSDAQWQPHRSAVRRNDTHEERAVSGSRLGKHVEYLEEDWVGHAQMLLGRFHSRKPTVDWKSPTSQMIIGARCVGTHLQS